MKRNTSIWMVRDKRTGHFITTGAKKGQLSSIGRMWNSLGYLWTSLMKYDHREFLPETMGCKEWEIVEVELVEKQILPILPTLQERQRMKELKRLKHRRDSEEWQLEQRERREREELTRLQAKYGDTG